ncbi:MAG: DUF1573 domain-containing protein [Alistipes sp.]|nr:DUF1573 domain-containing protein [Alistipes sp.]
MKRLIILLIIVLSANSLFAQLRFEKADYDFGTLTEEGGKQTCSFVGVNVGDKPIVILDVVTSCGCTVPEFSRKPIRPGEQSLITVTYDPYGRPGSFDRKLYLYGPSRERLATLTIRGEVTPRERSIEERYPIEAGDGLRLASTMQTFTYIYIGTSIRSAISMINSSEQPITLELIPSVESGLLAVEYPQQLAPGEQAAINFCYEVPATTPRYGTIRDALRLKINGRMSEKVVVTHGIGVDRPTKTIKESPPKMELSENMLKFGAVKQQSAPVKKQLTIRNSGKSELIIRAVSCEEPLSTDLQPDLQIAPGAEVTCQVLLDPSKADYGFMTEWLTLITNEPDRPMRRVRIMATIEG